MRAVAVTTLVFTAVMAAALPAIAETIELRSGNAPVGNPDPYTTVFREDPVTPITQAVVVPRNPVWTLPPSGAAWISTSPSSMDIGGYYIFQTTFYLPTNLSAASLSLTWSGDDGAWIDIGGAWWLGTGESLRTLVFNNANWLVPGENRLVFHVNNANIGPNPTALCYSATINYSLNSVPEPSGLLSLSSVLGIAALLWRRR